ncbi:aminotransferase class IV [Flavobacterium sp. xlx-214]|uniref:aminotransferase class IV n=1 Tax=unclassified Flavobacterium TaxID=196869 RepID=UPI0013D1822F|nr:MULTISPECIES: aminotransferase class IV [unclassified Flavobacterium]MBA5793249.1 aminotransferase class IV [Flavobacterium sp. xlx-221]QMI82468.1 aminotransferase class IV [Flavobacterium sp. xlx-214]
MINFNGTLVSHSNENIEKNRGFLYGDAVFETLKIFENKILFSEDHYFRLMASMRILRMEIPMEFNLEFMENEILKLTNHLNLSHARVRLTVFRTGTGRYLPKQRTTGFLITAESTQNMYAISEGKYEIEIYKDFHISKNLLNTLKTTNRLVNITASIFAEENSYENCLLINEDKNIIEAINGNVFVVKDQTIVTPPVSDGCINGILRKKLIDIIVKDASYTFEERSISPFELQKADEIFITNCIQGIQSVTKYRKKDFTNEIASKLLVKLNAQIRFNS